MRELRRYLYWYSKLEKSMATKVIRFTTLLDKEEREMLRELTKIMNRSGSSVIGTLIRERRLLLDQPIVTVRNLTAKEIKERQWLDSSISFTVSICLSQITSLCFAGIAKRRLGEMRPSFRLRLLDWRFLFVKIAMMKCSIRGKTEKSKQDDII